MKLTLNRREKEEKEGLFRKSVIYYYLDVNIELTQEEIELIKKHKWEDNPMCTEVFKHTQGLEWTMVVSVFTEGPKDFGFNSVERLASAEKQIIENAKLLKANLEAVSGFTTSGPQEIEL